MRKEYSIDAEELRSRVHYDPETGVFTRIKASGHNGSFRAGVVIGSLKKDSGYIMVGVAGRQYRAHRLAWLFMLGRWPVLQIDHINGNRSDNRWSNLREVTTDVNSQNRTRPQKDNKLGFLGVFKNKKRFSAQVKLRGVVTCLGTYDTPEEAHKAYVEAKRKIHVGCTI